MEAIVRDVEPIENETNTAFYHTPDKIYIKFDAMDEDNIHCFVKTETQSHPVMPPPYIQFENVSYATLRLVFDQVRGVKNPDGTVNETVLNMVLLPFKIRVKPTVAAVVEIPQEISAEPQNTVDLPQIKSDGEPTTGTGNGATDTGTGIDELNAYT